jgi:hypothetical protein
MNRLQILFLTIILVSCNTERIEFQDYFQAVRNANIPEGYTHFSYCKWPNNTLEITFEKDSVYLFKVQDKDSVKISNIIFCGISFKDSLTVAPKITRTLYRLYSKYNDLYINIVEVDDFMLKINFSLDRFDYNTLPKVKRKENQKGQKINGVLLHIEPAGLDNKRILNLVKYAQPVKLVDNWYYYEETFPDNDR